MSGWKIINTPRMINGTSMTFFKNLSNKNALKATKFGVRSINRFWAIKNFPIHLQKKNGEENEQLELRFNEELAKILKINVFSKQEFSFLRKKQRMVSSSKHLPSKIKTNNIKRKTMA